MIKRSYLLFNFSLALAGADLGVAQSGAWRTFTGVGDVREISFSSASVWAVSNGGVLQLDRNTFDIRRFTNTDGLASNVLVALEVDQHGSIWFALADGRLNRYFPESDEFDLILDYENQEITDLVAFGDSLYVGLDFGISLFTIDRQEVKETYRNFGFASGSDIEQTGANSITIDGLDIWVATDRGVAKSSLDLPNLQAPASWQQFTLADGLPSGAINKVVILAGIAYAATQMGVYRSSNGPWTRIGLENVDVRSAAIARANQFFDDDALLVSTSNSVYYLAETVQFMRLGGLLPSLTSVAVDEDGDIWAGSRNEGLLNYNFSTTEWDLHTTNSPASNSFKALALDSRGWLWCASQGGGVHLFDNGEWLNFSRASGLTSDDQRTVVVDLQDRVWFGSWGGGISILEDDGDGFQITQIGTENGILAGSVTPEFVVINQMNIDSFGNIWALNRETNNTLVLAAFNAAGLDPTDPDNWVHYPTSAVEGIPTTLVLAIEVDEIDRIWVGTQTAGIRVLDYKQTFFDMTDDDFSGFLTTGDGLITNKVTAVNQDKTGTIWIGTEEGLNFWTGTVDIQFGLINDVVNTIGIDARNNKWIGTANGITVIRENGQKLADYTTGNSLLVSNNVQSFAFNEQTGEVWIGTTNGLSRLQTAFTAPKDDLTLLSGFPNPYIIDDGNSTFTITNLSRNSTVRVYTVSGVLIRSFSLDQIQGAQIVWDGRDDQGDFVASGIYVYLAYTESDLSATGKVSVIRR